MGYLLAICSAFEFPYCLSQLRMCTRRIDDTRRSWKQIKPNGKQYFKVLHFCFGDVWSTPWKYLLYLLKMCSIAFFSWKIRVHLHSFDPWFYLTLSGVSLFRNKLWLYIPVSLIAFEVARTVLQICIIGIFLVYIICPSYFSPPVPAPIVPISPRHLPTQSSSVDAMMRLLASRLFSSSAAPISHLRLVICAFLLSSQASDEQSRHSVLPVPVGLSKMPFHSCAKHDDTLDFEII